MDFFSEETPHCSRTPVLDPILNRKSTFDREYFALGNMEYEQASYSSGTHFFSVHIQFTLHGLPGVSSMTWRKVISLMVLFAEKSN